MYKATRDFINARKKWTKDPLRFPKYVKKLGTGEFNKCFENANNFLTERKKLGEKITLISGWLINPYDVNSDSTAIVQHWWCGDDQGNQFDTTPGVTDEQEYIIDFDINNFAVKNFKSIKSCVGMSLLYRNRSFFLLRDADSMLFEEIIELRTERLFKYLEPN